MKKILVFIFLLSGFTYLMADSIYLPMQMDAGVFISYGVYPGADEDNFTFDDLSLLLESLRGGVSITGRYEFNEQLSAGLEVGLATITYNDTVVLVDVPVNIVGRFGYENLFVEPHIGAYFSSLDSLSGFSFGAKGLAGNWYLDISMIVNEEPYTRYTFGYQVNNFL